MQTNDRGRVRDIWKSHMLHHMHGGGGAPLQPLHCFNCLRHGAISSQVRQRRHEQRSLEQSKNSHLHMLALILSDSVSLQRSFRAAVDNQTQELDTQQKPIEREGAWSVYQASRGQSKHLA